MKPVATYKGGCPFLNAELNKKQLMLKEAETFTSEAGGQESYKDFTFHISASKRSVRAVVWC
jgi:hypothetical protein